MLGRGGGVVGILLFHIKTLKMIFLLQWILKNGAGVVLLHRELCQYFREKFANISALKIESFSKILPQYSKFCQKL